MDLPQKLKEQGYRLTQPRQEVLKALTDHPQTVQQLHDALIKKEIAMDIASVYRSVELFVNMGLVYAIDLGGDSKLYELVNKTKHHHHLVCNSCGKVEDITINEENLTKEIQQKSKFLVDHHHLEFFGLCANCQ